MLMRKGHSREICSMVSGLVRSRRRNRAWLSPARDVMPRLDVRVRKLVAGLPVRNVWSSRDCLARCLEDRRALLLKGSLRRSAMLTFSKGYRFTACPLAIALG